ncbi:AAA family ATPase [Acinetobacter chinensis]|uniref:AAA family ATPase n=1 Tax=Acinetobacter chinensis TaxID=2004650 RepID=UPI0029345040|nr:ATP-binding protein [Acinetobacter chinensis]WOE40035.1 ATP-binding protein [Acinetobacter chinensis]
MLVRFSVENFLSFKERTYFSMIPGKTRSKAYHKNKPVSNVQTLKFSAIFGANASGKSNLIKSIDFGKRLIVGNEKLSSIDNQVFKLTSTTSPNSRFEYEIQANGKMYAYGFIISRRAIIEEWLYLVAPKSETLIFERSNEQISLNDEFLMQHPKNEKDFWNFVLESVKADKLILNHIAQLEIKKELTSFEHIKNVLGWFKNSLTIVYPKSRSMGIHFELLQNADLRSMFGKFLAYFDTGIDSIDFLKVDPSKVKIPPHILDDSINRLLEEDSEKTTTMISEPSTGQFVFLQKEGAGVSCSKMVTKRKIYGSENHVEFDTADEESDGTKRLLDLIPLLVDSIDGDNVIIIDEIERSLHPNLVMNFIEFYLDSSRTMSNKTQLILATHESGLLDQTLIRKDEVWFIAKSKDGSSHVSSLEEFKVRFDKELRKNYLIGRFNGIPKFGNRLNLEDTNGNNYF